MIPQRTQVENSQTAIVTINIFSIHFAGFAKVVFAHSVPPEFHLNTGIIITRVVYPKVATSKAVNAPISCKLNLLVINAKTMSM